jgi:hypothetical protein
MLLLLLFGELRHLYSSVAKGRIEHTLLLLHLKIMVWRVEIGVNDFAGLVIEVRMGTGAGRCEGVGHGRPPRVVQVFPGRLHLVVRINQRASVTNPGSTLVER